MTPLDIVHTESSLGWGGQEIRILSEAAGLLERGHLVRLLCPKEARIHGEAARFRIPVEALPIGRKNLRGLLAMTDWIRSQEAIVNRCVFSTHSSTDAWLVALGLQALGKPFPMVRTRHISARVSRNRPTRWLYASAASRVVTTGQALRGQLIEDLGIAPDRIDSVPTGIDTTRFVPGERGAARARLGLPDDKTLVGIVATLRSWKGHRYLIEALAGMPGGIGLVIVGDGPQRAALDSLVASHGMSDRTWMPGNQNDVLPWLHAMDIFALPSYANEGVPQALIQAMLVALPCVTTTAGSIAELARHEETALLARAQDAEALRGAIGRLIDNPELGERLGAAARTHCLAHYSREQMLDRMEAIFGMVAADAARR
jgi:glycosyltransferase involved in cell wall biosynthesis